MASNSISRFLPKELEICWTKTWLWMFIAALCTIMKRSKQFKCSSINKYETCDMPTYWGTIQSQNMNDVPAHATQRMNLEHIMLSEKSWAQKVHDMWFHADKLSRADKFVKTERLGEGREGNHRFLGMGLLFKVTKSWKWVMAVVRGHWMPSVPLKLTLKIHVYFGLQ